MNKYARDMLMRRRDMRNPYGSRGGYVVSDRAMEDMARGRGGNRGGRSRDYGNDYNRGSDYAGNYEMGRGRDYADYAEYDSRQDYNDYARGDYARYGRDYEQGGQYGNDGGYGYGVGMFDYDTEDYARYGRDGHNKLSRREIKKWEKGLENADGTKGPKWQVDQIKQIAQQQGIKFDEYSPELFAVVMNALYSDYSKVFTDPIMYAKLTRAWLEDDDFDGEPEEKAMLYYKCIVAKDDD